MASSIVFTLEAHDIPLPLQEDDSLLSPSPYTITLKVSFLPHPPLLLSVVVQFSWALPVPGWVLPLVLIGFGMERRFSLNQFHFGNWGKTGDTRTISVV